MIFIVPADLELQFTIFMCHVTLCHMSIVMCNLDRWIQSTCLLCTLERNIYAEMAIEYKSVGQYYMVILSSTMIKPQVFNRPGVAGAVL